MSFLKRFKEMKIKTLVLLMCADDEAWSVMFLLYIHVEQACECGSCCNDTVILLVTTIAESFFNTKKSVVLFWNTTAAENWNNDLIGHGDLFATLPHFYPLGNVAVKFQGNAI